MRLLILHLLNLNMKLLIVFCIDKIELLAIFKDDRLFGKVVHLAGNGLALEFYGGVSGQET
jgi:hypothetical protein